MAKRFSQLFHRKRFSEQRCLKWAGGRFWLEFLQNSYRIFTKFSQNCHRITSIMFKPFLEQVNGLEKAGTSFRKLGTSRKSSRSLLRVLRRTRTLQGLLKVLFGDVELKM